MLLLLRWQIVSQALHARGLWWESYTSATGGAPSEDGMLAVAGCQYNVSACLGKRKLTSIHPNVRHMLLLV